MLNPLERWLIAQWLGVGNHPRALTRPLLAIFYVVVAVFVARILLLF